MKNLVLVFIGIFAFSCSNTETETTEIKTKDTLSLEEVWSTDTTSFLTPESVIYDAVNEIYYVACINGVPPYAKDGDGYIGVLNKDGSIKEANWITGMDAPKGMGILDGKLLVTDITQIHEIDIASGEITNSYEVKGSQFLNDITVAGEDVFISDSNTSTLYKLSNGEVSAVVQNDGFGGSNGLYYESEQLYVAGFGSGDFHRIDLDGQNAVLVADSIKGGDGIVKYGEDFLVSNWNGEIYSISPEGKTTLLLDTKSSKRNAADIAIGAESDLLVVPEFFANKVTAYHIK